MSARGSEACKYLCRYFWDLNICTCSGFNRCTFLMLILFFFLYFEGVTYCFTCVFDLFLFLTCVFLKILFLVLLWNSRLIWRCNIVSLNVAHALCTQVTLNTSSSITSLLFLSYCPLLKTAPRDHHDLAEIFIFFEV